MRRTYGSNTPYLILHDILNVLLMKGLILDIA